MLTQNERDNNREQAYQWWKAAPKSFGLLPRPETEEQRQQCKDIDKFHCDMIRKGRAKYQ